MFAFNDGSIQQQLTLHTKSPHHLQQNIYSQTTKTLTRYTLPKGY